MEKYRLILGGLFKLISIEFYHRINWMINIKDQILK